jgi:hypothetical protein
MYDELERNRKEMVLPYFRYYSICMEELKIPIRIASNLVNI